MRCLVSVPGLSILTGILPLVACCEHSDDGCNKFSDKGVLNSVGAADCDDGASEGFSSVDGVDAHGGPVRNVKQQSLAFRSEETVRPSSSGESGVGGLASP